MHGTLVGAWASPKTFQPKAGPADPKDWNGSNPSVDFHGQKRSNATHRSTTDPAAQLARKGKGKEARLCFGLHALMENRHGLCVQAQVTTAHGVTEGAAATELLGRQLDTAEQPPTTLGADKSYHSAKVAGFCRREGIRPHSRRSKADRWRGWTGGRHAPWAIKPARSCATGSRRFLGEPRQSAACGAPARGARRGWA